MQANESGLARLSGKLIREVTAKANEQMRGTVKESHLVVIMGSVIDIQQGRGAKTAKQIAEELTDLRNISKKV